MDYGGGSRDIFKKGTMENVPESRISTFFTSTGRAILLPVVHCGSDEDLVIRNVHIAQKCGAQGVFLINHKSRPDTLIRHCFKVTEEFPNYWIGVNILGSYPHEVFKMIPEELRSKIKGIWADDAGIDERLPSSQQNYPKRALLAAKDVSFDGLYFGGIAFKYQREVSDLESAAKCAKNCGPATGSPPIVEKIKRIRSALGDKPLAIASGISSDNIRSYLPHANIFLVSTSISKNEYELDEEKLSQLIKIMNEETK